MSAMERQYRISRNEFFIAVAMLAISIYNKKNDIKISWIYNGREDMQSMSTVGLLFRDLPVGLHLKEKATIRDIFAEIHTKSKVVLNIAAMPMLINTTKLVMNAPIYSINKILEIWVARMV